MDDEDNYGPTATRVHWLTIDAAEPGMVLARPVFATQKGVLSLTLAVGTKLTVNTLLQLIAQGVECVGVEEHVAEDAEMAVLRHSIHRQRLEEIFGAPGDELDPTRRLLFDALLSAGSWR